MIVIFELLKCGDILGFNPIWLLIASSGSLKLLYFCLFLKRQLGSVFRLVTELCFDLAFLVQNCSLILSWAIEAYVMNVIASLGGGL